MATKPTKDHAARVARDPRWETRVEISPPKKRVADKPHDTFVCVGCRATVSATFGCCDDMPHHCDDCWLLAHPELVPVGNASSAETSPA